MAGILHIDIEIVLDHISHIQLAQKITDVEMDDNHTKKIRSFLTNKWVEFVINSFTNTKYKVKTEISKELAVCLIHFLI